MRNRYLKKEAVPANYSTSQIQIQISLDSCAFSQEPSMWIRHIRKRLVEVNDQKAHYLHQDVYCALASLCGLPATVFPVGITQAGLPIGLQAIGLYLEDRTPLRFATLVAEAFGGFRCPPGFE